MDINNIIKYFETFDGRIVFGIDGYIDEVWQVIESRIDRERYVLRDKMKGFGELILNCGEGGVSNEILRKRRTYGGFTANTGKAAGSLGANVTLLGMFGKDNIEPVFGPLAEAGTLISVGDPAVSQIYEFEDGKLMLPYIQEISSFNWQALLSAVSTETLEKIFADADIIALGYWSLMPAFDEIVDRVCEMLPGDSKPRRMFFDFADIRKRDRASLTHTLCALAKLNKKIPMTLSLNEHEAGILFGYYGEDFSLDPKTAPSRLDIFENVRRQIGLDELVVHTPYFAAAAGVSAGTAFVQQRYCEKPVITTGAGDNFNGGYLAAGLGGLSFSERLFAGNAATGFYLRSGRSATRADMLLEISELSKEWQNLRFENI